MDGIDYLPLVLAGLCGLVGLFTWEVELLVLWLGGGYFIGKLLQSLVWAVEGPATST